ncbi:MAG: hypothetical protein WCH82_08775 [Mycobacteriaceae bacterium]
MRKRSRRITMVGLCCPALLISGITLAAGVSAQTCAPGFVPNPYNAQCLAPVSTPTIQGVPCVPSNLAVCLSLAANLPVPRPPASR